MRTNAVKLLPFIVLIQLFLLSCTNPAEPKDSSGEIKQDSITVIDEANYDGPPFDDSCACNFDSFGFYKISNDNFHIYYGGKGWNPEFYSCSWTWGEMINNEMPEDTNISNFKIHLLDLAYFTIPDNNTEYGNDSIKNYVIAVYARNRKTGNFNCIFDPYKTGKYPAPKQWVED